MGHSGNRGDAQGTAQEYAQHWQEDCRESQVKQPRKETAHEKMGTQN